MPRVTLIDDAVDAVYYCEPPSHVSTVLAPDEVTAGWCLKDGDWVAPSPALDRENARRSAKLAAISATADALLAAGAPVSGGLHVALDDRSSADLMVMASAATAASIGTVAWPESYSRGWIAVENVRIPLAAPADGLALAASVGDWYAAVVQHRRDLKDAALAAEDAAALDAIDIAAGWPAA